MQMKELLNSPSLYFVYLQFMAITSFFRLKFQVGLARFDQVDRDSKVSLRYVSNELYNAGI